ncbi:MULTISPECIES: hypothetical protein [Rhodococcus]|uniref:hypothetical protein n=1 Tax=Rhodococcus TaxID=1827 RepID=UPI001FFEDE88|nr:MULTISPECIES: hypothetical protein [Rhodococcus]MCW3471281.1 hypothetical protein [Rhodococcus pyridinivorans]UPK63911.1 hypothetical protein MYP14_00310 [Rhodococcus pyridinivorans]UPW04288.1 hypothetical protein M1C57_22280 [Rhodococcus pyridinivorans]
MTNELLCHVLSVFDIEAEPVTDGITRRRIHRSDFASSWLIEFAPGSCWPEVGRHTGRNGTTFFGAKSLKEIGVIPQERTSGSFPAPPTVPAAVPELSFSG